ncbi:putative holin [Providencia sp. 21OH12SH02B-Prov]|uniref:putative holin n=1 Tax=Providencia sp. 21OH12SH02B-Prov TaxID=3015951 RepID=UPI0022B6B47D|nr:putative holin [Providencia sp. 21OH12SH02B-Prov]WBA58417.1 putative holin [Providencia sp. 21OH12SH02B-Prov]
MSTSLGIAIGAAGGGAMGGILVGADYGVVLGAIIGASASVIASKDNNRRKILHFILALGAGILIAKEASDVIAQIWNWDISPKITAIAISALLIPVLVLMANKDNLRKLFSRIMASIDKNFSTITQAIKDWRNKGGS